MRRCLGTALLTLTALLAPALATASADLPRVQLRGFVCQAALEPASRAISVTTVMRPLPGTEAMAERFALFARVAGARQFTPVTEPGTDLGKWVAPATSTLGRRSGDVWILGKPVVDLPAPAAYRLRIEFRWSGAHHRVLGLTTRRTPICHQPELRPDLLVRRVAAPTANRAGTATSYSITVANAGASAATAFAVQLASPGAPAVTRMLSGLAAHAETTIQLNGPPCAAAAPPVVTVDPQGDVQDFNRANNIATASCTAATTPF